MNIFNDKQMDESYEPKGNDELSLNAINWLAHRETKVSNIADVRKLADETEVVVEGTVTTGAGVFFDAFNLQDETGGIMAFQEVPDGSLKSGDKVRVYGHIKTFDNNKELEFTSFSKDVIKIGTGEPLQPKVVPTGEATSAANQGLLVKVKGTVVSKFDENSYVINDGSGDVLVFTDGYIVNQSNVPVPVLAKGDTLEAVGLSGSFAQGTRIRVRDTRELIGTQASGSDPSESDTTAPIVSGVENNRFYNNNVTITFNEGTAKLDGKKFASGTKVTAEGSYTLVVTDEAGNVTTIQFTIDKTAPKKPKVDKITADTTKVIGEAEAGTIVEVKDGNKILGSAVADKKGQFSVEIASQKIDNVLSVYSEDQAGNISKVTNEKVKK